MTFLSIVVLNYNRLKYTKQTIENLIDKTSVKHEFVFVDNGSKDGTRRYLRSLKGKTNAVREIYVMNKYNYGVSGGRNSGLVHTRGDYIMTIDDDILVPENYDNLLVDALNIKSVGMSGVSVEKKIYPIVDIDGVSVQKKNENLNGGCLSWTRKNINRLGFFDPDTVYGGDDTQMFLRVKALGLLSVYIVPNGIHIDENLDQEYVEFKKKMHEYNSIAMRHTGYNTVWRNRRNNQHVPYRVPNRFKGKYDIMPKINRDGNK